MYDTDYAFVYIANNRRAELDDRLDRISRYNLYPAEKKIQHRNSGKISLFLISVRNLFFK